MAQGSSIKHKSKLLSCVACWILTFTHFDSAMAQIEQRSSSARMNERGAGETPAYPIELLDSGDLEPLTPEPTKPEQYSPLPPTNNPFKTIPNPPVPDSVLDIPGTIEVKEFEFVGNTVFSQAELNQAIANFTNKQITFAQLVQAANQITQLYVSQGYITTGAYVPEQSLTSSKVKIQIVEGSLAEIEVNITGRLKESYVRDRIAQKTSTPLNINQLQSALQLLQLNPIIGSLNAELSSGVLPGTNILTVSVSSADTFSLQTQLNNNRNPSIGTFERGIKLEEENLLGIGDRFNLAYINTKGSNQFEGGYILPLNTRDGTLGFNFRWAQNEIVQSSLKKIDIDIESRNYDLTWRQPLLQKATPKVSQELAINITAARRASESTILNEPQALSPGANEDGEIRTSVLSFGQEWLHRNPHEVISASSQFNLGVDLLNATILPEEPDGEFFSWRGQFSYLRSLSQPQPEQPIVTTLLLRSELQIAADPLISTEQFNLGGATTVRGYRQDAVLSDSGFLATAELRLPIAYYKPINATLQFSPFIDFGTAWDSDDEALESNTLLGTGFGLLLQTPERFSARVDWGIPLINKNNQRNSLQENGVYFQLQYDLF